MTKYRYWYLGRRDREGGLGAFHKPPAIKMNSEPTLEMQCLASVVKTEEYYYIQ